MSKVNTYRASQDNIPEKKAQCIFVYGKMCLKILAPPNRNSNG